MNLLKYIVLIFCVFFIICTKTFAQEGTDIILKEENEEVSSSPSLAVTHRVINIEAIEGGNRVTLEITVTNDNAYSLSAISFTPADAHYASPENQIMSVGDLSVDGIFTNTWEVLTNLIGGYDEVFAVMSDPINLRVLAEDGEGHSLLFMAVSETVTE